MSSFNLTTTYRNTGVLTVAGDLSLSIFPKNTSYAVVTGDITGNIYFKNTGSAIITGTMANVASGPFANYGGAAVALNCYLSQKGIVTFSGTIGNNNFSGSGTLSGKGIASISGDVPSGIPWIFRSLFSTIKTAPISNPYPGEVGGNWATSDVESGLSSNGVRLTATGQSSTPVWSEQELIGPAETRTQGRALFALVTVGDKDADFAFGWSNSATPTTPDSAGSFWENKDGSLLAATPSGLVAFTSSFREIRPIQYLCAIVQQSTGALYFLSTFAADSGGGMLDPRGIPQYPTALLYYVERLNTTTPLYPAATYLDAAGGAHNLEDVRTINITSDPKWSSFNGIANNYSNFNAANGTGIGSYTSNTGQAWTSVTGTLQINSNVLKKTVNARSVGKTTTSGADGIFCYTFKTPASGAWDFRAMMRIQDDSNHMLIDCNSGNVIALYKKVAGAYTPIQQTAKTWVASTIYRLTVYATGNQYFIMVDNVSPFGPYQTDPGNNFLTQTGIGVDDNSGNVAQALEFSECTYFPNTLTFPSELQVGAIPTIASPGATVGQDSFTDTNGTNLTAHAAQSGGAWATPSGTWTIQSNRATVSAVAGSNFALQTLNATLDTSVDIITPGSFATGVIRAGIVFNYVDANNYIIARLFKDPSQVNNDEIELNVVIGGSASNLKKVNIGAFFAVATTYTLEVQTFSTGLIQILLGGKPRLSYYKLATTPNGTKWGLYRENVDDGCVFDNWLAKQL